MSNGTHERAEKLIAQDRVEGISQKEREWLDGHLRECAECSASAVATATALKALRGVAVPVPRGLAERTKFRVQLRTMELREREPKRRLLWVLCAVSWGLGIASAPYVWQGIQWIGQWTGAPRLVLEFGFGLWWAVPALFAAAIVVIEYSRQVRERDSSGT